MYNCGAAFSVDFTVVGYRITGGGQKFSCCMAEFRVIKSNIGASWLATFRGSQRRLPDTPENVAEHPPVFLGVHLC